MHRSLVGVSALAVVGLFRTTAHADPAPPALVNALRLPALLVGGVGGGHGHATRAPYGWFLGADAGVAWLLGNSDVTTHATSSSSRDPSAWCFAGRLGYQFASGLAVQARFDNLGVDSPDGSGRVMVASAGVRYSLPIVPMPFAEALVGPMIHGSGASATVGFGVGASLFVARHVGFDVAVRDWIFDLDGVHDIPSLMLGMSAGFGG